MLQYIVRRVLLLIPTLFIISVLSFTIIQLPPGDYLTSYLAELEASGDRITETEIRALEEYYGVNESVYVQYFKWISNILLRGDFGRSLDWGRPVADLLWERVGLTFIVSFGALIFTWIIAFPLGVYSAIRRYSIGDYFATFFGFLGLATPDFMLALVLMWVMFAYFNQSVGGLFSPEYIDAPWTLGKVWDLFKHLWIPFIVLGTNGIAGLSRIMRANLLDELNRPYVVTARTKGLPEHRMLIKYPVRAALNPFISTVGWHLPGLISGSTIVGIVLSLPLTGPLLLRALQTQDMFLAGSFILILSVLTVIGTLISDLLLAWLDPRIRLS
ncbi:MAG: ABC transporter permease [Chloroflexales bacterium]|nr:ABC transporter permease [Chloroflexales bacterium]